MRGQPIVKTLMGPECTMCAKGVTVGSKVISGIHSGFKGDQWDSLWVQGPSQRARGSGSMEEESGIWNWSQDVNKYRTREYHYN